MQIRVEVQALGEGWAALVHGCGQDAPVARNLRRLAGAADWPFPAQDVAEALDDTAPHKALCLGDHERVGAILSNIALRSPGTGELEALGRYLFELLIGTELWSRALEAADNGPIEFALCFPHDDTVFGCLPWELMHDGTKFLAEVPRVALYRRVATTGPVPAGYSEGEIASPPRVLFVVGTGLNDDVIRPGAEFLRLLLSLQRKDIDLSLRTRLLLQATKETVAAAVEEFQPDVVHFICHGWFDEEGLPYLQLVDNDNADKVSRAYASHLDALLRSAPDGGRRPRVVVLSACHSAGAGHAATASEPAVPLSVALVRTGVPMVVGMAGRVADQACRLFTRSFYEALLKDGDVALAAARGRNGAISGGASDPRVSVDWSKPVLFVSDRLPSASFAVEVQANEQAWQRAAGEFAPGPQPVFCDRLELVGKLDLLTAGIRQKQLLRRDRDLQALAIAVEQPDGEGYDRECMGRTWLLKELAAKCVRDGHVPVLVSIDEVGGEPDVWPKNLGELVCWISNGVENTLARFEVDPPPAPDAAGKSPRDLAGPVREYLLEALARARALRPDPERDRAKLVLLLDDMHRMGQDAVEGFLKTVWGGATGLRKARADVRMVFTYSSKPTVGQERTVKTITDWLGSWAWVDREVLGRFRAPVEENQAYEHYLLNWAEDKLSLVHDSGHATDFFESLREEVKGVPSFLERKAPPVIRAVRRMLKDKLFRPAKDHEILANLRERRGERP